MSILSEIFSWWGGSTWGTRMTLMFQGRHVGTDELGNRYYVQSRGPRPIGLERRWVVYKDLADASRVSPDWHGWLHHTVDTLPTAEDYKPRAWQKAHRPNMTGTPDAYRPSGSILSTGQRPKATGDYKAWQPE